MYEKHPRIRTRPSAEGASFSAAQLLEQKDPVWVHWALRRSEAGLQALPKAARLPLVLTLHLLRRWGLCSKGEALCLRFSLPSSPRPQSSLPLGVCVSLASLGKVSRLLGPQGAWDVAASPRKHLFKVVGTRL